MRGLFPCTVIACAGLSEDPQVNSTEISPGRIGNVNHSTMKFGYRGWEGRKHVLILYVLLAESRL